MWFRKAPARNEVAAEIEKQKDAIKSASRENVKANLDLVTTVKNNGFTVIIAATMGAKRHVETGNNNGH